jgi:hypothetical protein
VAHLEEQLKQLTAGPPIAVPDVEPALVAHLARDLVTLRT